MKGGVDEHPLHVACQTNDSYVDTEFKAIEQEH